MANDRPAEVFPPGDFLREELEARGWTQADLATIIGRPLQSVNLIITGKKVITPRTATELAAAFGTSPELWLNLQAAYSLSRQDADVAAIRSRAQRRLRQPSTSGRAMPDSRRRSARTRRQPSRLLNHPAAR